MSNDTTLLFGLAGVRVERVVLLPGGIRVVHVQTAAEGASGCPSCGVLSSSMKGNVVTAPRDIPYGTGPVAVVWHKRRWRCREALCERQSFTETVGELPSGARTTRRLREAIGVAIGDANRAVSEVAAGFGVSWPTAHAAFVEMADRDLAAPAPTRILGIDETRRGKPRWEQHPATGKWALVDRWHSGFVDLDGAQGLLGQVLGRAAADVTDWLDAQGEEFCDAIEFVAIDPCAAYRRAVTDRLPQAQIVVDHFHLVRLANAAVTAVRQRVTWDNRGRRGRKVDPEWTNRRRLLTGRERLTHKRFTAMWNSCLDADPSGQILTAWIAKEELRALLATARTGGHRHDISHRLYRFYTWCANADIPEITRLARTIEDWWPETAAFCRTAITNAKTEGTNRLIKDVGRRLRLPQPRQPTPPSTVLLHPAITPEHSQTRGDARSKLKSRLTHTPTGPSDPNEPGLGTGAHPRRHSGLCGPHVPESPPNAGPQAVTAARDHERSGLGMGSNGGMLGPGS